MRKVLATILLMFSTVVCAEFKLDSINDLQNTLKDKDPQRVGIAIGYIRGIEDAMMMMIVYQESEGVKFHFKNSEKKWPSVFEMINLLSNHLFTHPTHGNLPLEYMMLTTLMDDHYLEKEKIIK